MKTSKQIQHILNKSFNKKSTKTDIRSAFSSIQSYLLNNNKTKNERCTKGGQCHLALFISCHLGKSGIGGYY